MGLAAIICCLLVAVALLGATEARRCPVLHATEDTEKTGCYIVVLKQATTAAKFQSVLQKVVQMADGAKLYGSVTRVAKAFTVKLSSYALHAVSPHTYHIRSICHQFNCRKLVLHSELNALVDQDD